MIWCIIWPGSELKTGITGGALLFGLWLGEKPAVNEFKNSLPFSLLSSESPLIGEGLEFLRSAIGEVSARVPSLAKSSSEPASS
jgi:hypothetical protein